MNKKHIDLDSLNAIFNPESVAIIGASSSPNKIGGRPVAMLKQGFKGKIYPVNPNFETVQELPAYPDLAAIPGTVDLVIIAVPGKGVEAAMEACAAKGVGGVIIFSSGFAETGESGAVAQQRVLAIARRAGIRVLGPNCMGVVNLGRHMIGTFHPAFASPSLQAGNIGLVSQSGAFGGFSYFLAQDKGVSFSYLMTTGNESDVDLADGVAFLAEDPATKVILVYMEGCRNGPKLLEALDLARRNHKPVVMVKLGRSEAGATAAASHTSALAGADEVFEAVMRQYGVYRAHSVEEFFDIGAACSVGRLPKDNTVGLVTVSGGMGVLMADDASQRGLAIKAMPAEAQQRIKDIIPFAGTQNPIDATGQITSDFTILQRVADIVVEEGGYSSVVFFEGGLSRTERPNPITDSWISIANQYPDTSFSVVGLNTPEERNKLQSAGIYNVAEPTHATRAAGALAGFANAFNQLWQSPADITLPNVASALEKKTRSEVEALSVLLQAGIPVVEHYLVTSEDEAVAAAARIGGPVVMKIVSPDILHKSDIGAVKLNLRSEEEVINAHREILQAADSVSPLPRIQGCLVAPLVEGGVEAIIGTYKDQTFGPVVMFGLGGVFVEVLKDVTFRVAPFGVGEALRMIREIKSAKVLEGGRGGEAADVDALAKALSDLSVFAKQHEQTLDSIDINPLVIKPKGMGAVALDAVMLTEA